MVKPSQRKEMAQQAVSDHNVSIRLACQAFSISETCYRYQSILNSENEEIAEWLIHLTEKESDWGFGLCFDYLRNVEESLVLYRNDFPAYFSALDEERVIAVNDARTAIETREFTQSYLDVLGITSMLDTPIRHNGKTVGIICTEHRGETRQWQDDEMVFSGVLSDLFGRAINAREKLDYEQKLIETNQNLEALVAKRTEYLEETIEKMKLLQKQLIESEKLASLGCMVAGIAHEVNTPLGIALTATSHLKQGLKTLAKYFSSNSMTRDQFSHFIEDSDNALDLSENNLNRAVTLISNFKKTSADQNHFEYEKINIKNYIDKIISTLVPITKQKHASIKIKSPEIEKITLPGAVAQIIANLVSNSCSHSFSSQQGPAIITIEVEELDQDKIQLCFEDNGCGMSDDEVKRAFEPFYTTKRSEGGTGLGLLIVYTLATQNLKGSIDVASVQGEGTKFKLIF